MADARTGSSRNPDRPAKPRTDFSMKILSFSVVRLALSGFVGGLAAYIAWVVVDWILSTICGTGQSQAMASLGDFFANGITGDGGATGADLLKSGAAGAAGTAAGGETYRRTDDTWGIRVDPPPEE